MKISALILTKNEQDLIEETLSQLKFADEIIVLDQNSDDKTVEIAQKYATKILSAEVEDFSQNRNRLKEEAKNEWLLYIDADERISQENIAEIEKTLKKSKHSAYLGPQSRVYRGTRTAECSAFYFPRQNDILGKFQRHGGWWPDYVPRLFKKSDLVTWKGKVHESPQIKGLFGYLKTPIKHKTARNLSVMLEKSTKWAQIEAELYAKSDMPKVTIARVIRFSIVEFLKRYFIKLGFLDGKIGLISAVYQALHNAMILTYLWEIQNDSEKKFQHAERI